jgi:hypothetical protein
MMTILRLKPQDLTQGGKGARRGAMVQGRNSKNGSLNLCDFALKILSHLFR